MAIVMIATSEKSVICGSSYLVGVDFNVSLAVKMAIDPH